MSDGVHSATMQSEPMLSVAEMWTADPCPERAAALYSAARVGVLAEVCERLRAEPVPRMRRSAATWLASALWLDSELRARGLD